METHSLDLRCIYCPTPADQSESHIIPESFGKGPTLRIGVCSRCNHDVNQLVEQSLAKEFSEIRSFLGLEGKRGGRPQMPVKARFASGVIDLKLRDMNHLEKSGVVFNDVLLPGAPAKNIAFVGDPQAIEKHRLSFERRHPDATWTEIPREDIEEGLTFWVEIDAAALFSELYRRLMAKIAIEWFCKQRDIESIQGLRSKSVARYVLGGTAAEPDIDGTIRVVTDPGIYSGVGVPFGPHSLLTVADRRTQRVTVYVGLFSWIYFEVVVAERYPVLKNWNRLTTVHPQTGIVYEPTLRRHLSDRLDRWRLKTETPESARAQMMDILLYRLNEGLENGELMS